MLRLVVAGLNLNCLILQRFLEQHGLLIVAHIFPATYVHVILVVTCSFAVGGLVLFAEVCAARFVAVQCVDSHHLGDYQEVLQTESLFQARC